MTAHHWFRSGSYSLLGHIDLHPKRRGRLGVLIVPPFGFEDVCSYRALRSLGRTFAASGIPALRFDLPGAGDSSGDAQDLGLFDAWIQSVSDAAAELRAATDVRDVAVVGIRLGAMLALTAAIQGSNIQDLVLWGPTSTGRAMVRELQALANMERPEYADGQTPPPPPVPGFEIGGFLMTSETKRALEALDLSAIPAMPGRRILVLSRDHFAADAKLVRALESAECTVEVRPGSGYAAMMLLPHEALPPTETGRMIVEFLTKESPDGHQDHANAVVAITESVKTAAAQAATIVTEVEGTHVRETIYTLGRSPTLTFGVLSEPEPEAVLRPEWCILFLNPGAARHIGPNRMWVKAARRWAARGVVSLRLDLQGIGESDGERRPDIASLYHDQMVEQVEAAMEFLRSRLGFRRFAAVGLCSGAFWAFHAAIRNRDIRAAVLLNPSLFFWDPEVDRRRALRRSAKGLTNWADWSRLARGEVRMETIKQVARIWLERVRRGRTNDRQRLQIPPARMARAWEAIEHNQCRLTLIFSKGQPLLNEMEQEGQLPPKTSSCIRCIRVANGGHTFRPLWAQYVVHELIDGEIRELFCENFVTSGVQQNI